MRGTVLRLATQPANPRGPPVQAPLAMPGLKQSFPAHTVREGSREDVRTLVSGGKKEN